MLFFGDRDGRFVNRPYEDACIIAGDAFRRTARRKAAAPHHINDYRHTNKKLPPPKPP